MEEIDFFATETADVVLSLRSVFDWVWDDGIDGGTQRRIGAEEITWLISQPSPLPTAFPQQPTLSVC